MRHPALILPEAMPALLALQAASRSGDVPAATLELVHLRASQINGCESCIEAGTRQALRAGETDQRLAAIPAWQGSPHFSDAERAALALAEAVTSLGGAADPVPDAVWDEATRHYGEAEMAALVLSIAVTNVWNRLNVSTRQAPGAW